MEEEEIRHIVKDEVRKIMNAGRRKQDSGLPGMEFEGPFAFFWDLKDVPIESIAIGMVELLEEANRRGYTIEQVIQMAKRMSIEAKI